MWVDATFDPDAKIFASCDSDGALANNGKPERGSEDRQCLVVVVKGGEGRFKAQSCQRDRAKGLCLVDQ